MFAQWGDPPPLGMFQVFPREGAETNTFLLFPTFQFVPLSQGRWAVTIAARRTVRVKNFFEKDLDKI